MKNNIVVVVLFVVLLFAVGIIGYQLNNNSDNENVNETSVEQEPSENTVSSDVSKLISFNTPSEWREKSCPNDPGSVYFATTNSAEVDCSVTPDSQIKLSVSTENYTECSQIPEKQEVKKHICVSKFINDLRSLQADTEYLSSSSFGKETVVQTFYIDSGSGIVKAEYIHAGSGSDQSGFENLVNSIKSK